jgi:hypothetical protein
VIDGCHFRSNVAGRATRAARAGRARMRNPLRSEDAMFRVVLWAVALAAVIVAVVELVRAVS